MIFHDHIDPQWLRVFRESSQAIRSEFRTLFVGLVGFSVNSDGVAAQELCCIDPLIMVLNSSSSFGGVAVAEAPLAVNHDQYIGNAIIRSPLFHFGQVLFVFGLVFEKLIHILDSFDAKPLLSDFCKIEIVDLLAEQGLVKRPLRQRYFEWFHLCLREGDRRGVCTSDGCCGCD